MSTYRYTTHYIAIAFLFMSTATVVHADTRVRGQVLYNGRPAAQAKLSIFCDNGALKPVYTNTYGAFQTSIPSTRKNCKIEVFWDKRISERVRFNHNSSQVVLSINLRIWNNKWLLDIR